MSPRRPPPPATPPVAKYVAYRRVSTEQQGRSGLGLAAQREIIDRFVAAAGGVAVGDFTEVMSGRKGRRPQLEAALAAAREAGATLVVAKLDRLMRDTRSLLALLDGDVPLAVCDVPTADDPDVTRMVLTVLSGMAEFESRRIGRRQREAIAAKKARDGRSGVGMDNPVQRKAVKAANRGRKKRAAEYRATVRPEVERLRARGMSLHEVAAVLNAAGGRTRHGKEWTYATVWQVLRR